MNVKKRLLDSPRMTRAIRRMAIEIVEKNRGLRDLIIVGIRSRGVPIGERIAKEIETMEGHPVPFGVLDITLYRDDLTTIAPQPVVKPTKLPEPIDDKVVVLVDDVLSSRAADPRRRDRQDGSHRRGRGDQGEDG